MGETTLPAQSETVEKLKDYRHPLHDSWNDVIESMMQQLPTIHELQDGCVYCDTAILEDTQSPETQNSVIRNSHGYQDDHEWNITNVFCSDDCLTDFIEETNNRLPKHPDIVRVGGRKQPIVEIHDAELYIDEQGIHSVSFPIPGALAGESDHGYTYEYTREPVYLKSPLGWVQSFIVDGIEHGDRFTYIQLDSDVSIEKLHHPDEEQRDRYWENREPQECPECESEFSDNRGADYCPFCDADIAES